LPLTAQSWDIQLARAAAYEKLSIFRGSLRDIIRQNRNASNKAKESVILTTLMTKLSIVEFYVAKMESYMRRKHESILKVEESKVPVEDEEIKE
jgi:hypothetical protein